MGEEKRVAGKKVIEAFDQMERISVASPFWNDDSRQTLAIVRDYVLRNLDLQITSCEG